ncbi:MAG: element excision factor XisI family protein [Isosphaeraceae bacterium]
MDSLENVRSIIESILNEYTKIPYAYGEIQTEPIFDRAHDRYLLMNVGWDSKKRVHGCLVHIDIIDGKLWIQRDGLEHGVATDLIEAGIPTDRIVLAFKPIEMRRFIPDYAVT